MKIKDKFSTFQVIHYMDDEDTVTIPLNELVEVNNQLQKAVELLREIDDNIILEFIGRYSLKKT